MSLPPELLAVVGAKYSRNNQGLEEIIGTFDFSNETEAIKKMFANLDYGHKSILDMIPLAVFMDEISILAAMQIFKWAPMGNGQESSTRYIKFDRSGTVDPDEWGIPTSKLDAWYTFINQTFLHYHNVSGFWTQYLEANPDVLKSMAPADWHDNKAKMERVKRNFVFDRSRYWIPACGRTNMMLVMSARAWEELVINLLSHWLPELNHIGEALVQELELAAPNITKHFTAKNSYRDGHEMEFTNWWKYTQEINDRPASNINGSEPYAHINMTASSHAWEKNAVSDMAYHNNRYDYIGTNVRMTPVIYGWSSVALAEIRDLNRHRTGSKDIPLIPRGFYGARDEMVRILGTVPSICNDALIFGQLTSQLQWNELASADKNFLRYTMLGTQFDYIQTTTMDKLVYTTELRTGPGAHYRYARHFRDLHAKIAENYPVFAAEIQVGQAEPE